MEHFQAEHSEARLDVFLHRRRPEISRTLWQKLIREGHVRLQGRTAAPNEKVKKGDCVDFEIPVPKKLELTPEAQVLTVLFEDKDMIVLNKAAGVVVHPGAGNWEHTLVQGLLHHCGESLSGIGGVERPGIVHRLDKDTSGVLVVAKNDAAHRSLAAQFLEHTAEKTYHLLAWGIFRHRHGEITSSIARDPRHRQKMHAVREGGRTAYTRYQVLEQTPEIAYVECQIQTGRTHQIRVHMSSIGHPIVGDRLYGRKRVSVLDQKALRQMLHAHRLALSHPRTQKRMDFIAPLPDDLLQLLAEARTLK